jgi:DNA-binding response OmpR family regulator
MTESLPRLMLVDDEPNIIVGITRRLHREYEIFSANSGAQALELLAVHGAMHIIVSDMRMPLMNGAALLQDAARLYPDMVRMLLTGQTDQASAVAAINDGQIFRFLVKPCAADVLRVQLKAALRQHELLSSERSLLEQTLRGAVQVLSEVLALALPEAFGKALRIRQRAQLLLESVGVSDSWRIEVAATLSQVGALTLSQDTATKLYRGQPLSPSERAAVDRLPAVAVEMLKRIPRLESVCELITLGFGPASDVPPATLEAQALRLAADFEVLHATGTSSGEIALALQARGYAVELLDALRRSVGIDGAVAHVADVTFDQLRDGMLLAEDVYSATGTLMLARGFVIKGSVIERLRGMRATLGKRDTLRVTLSD